MARYKNANWELDEPATSDQARLAVLMDIRDELQSLNTLLRCQNFLDIPLHARKTRLAVEGLRRDLKTKKGKNEIHD